MKRARVSSLSSDTAALVLEDVAAKYTALDSLAETPVIRCLLPPHEPQSFSTSASYEAHYLSEHTHRCVECHRNLPSARYLELHIAELHDPICAARRDAGHKIYMCFVDGCDKLCIDWKKRRSHLIDKHGFPRNYDFFVVKDGIDGRKSLLRRGIDDSGHRKSGRERLDHDTENDNSVSRLSSSNNTSPEEQLHAVRRVDANMPGELGKSPEPRDHGMDAVTSTLESLQMVPRSVTFGRRKGKAGFSKS